MVNLTLQMEVFENKVYFESVAVLYTCKQEKLSNCKLLCALVVQCVCILFTIKIIANFTNCETLQSRRQREFENFESMLHVSPLSPFIVILAPSVSDDGTSVRD